MISQSHELVLATFPILAKEEPKGNGLASLVAVTVQPAKTPKDKLVIKMKPCVVFFFFFFWTLVFVSKICNQFTIL